MTVSESRRKANAKWDKANMTTIGCRVRRDVAERFKQECLNRGTTINEVFCNVVKEYLADNTSPDG